MKTVTHKQVYKNGPFQGYIVNTTLCGRVSHAESDYNIGDEITCKLCLKIQADPSHWRNRNILQGM